MHNNTPESTTESVIEPSNNFDTDETNSVQPESGSVQPEPSINELEPDVNKLVGDGSQYKFVCNYVLWAHEKNKNDWSVDSFDKIVVISNVSEFWKLFNNFHKFDYINQYYFLMKENVVPLWEHPSNKNGGICSFKSKISDGMNMLIFLATMMAYGKITNDENDADDINGVSMSPHNNCIIVKIWNKNANNNIMTKMSSSILNKYSDSSIQYKKNSDSYSS